MSTEPEGEVLFHWADVRIERSGEVICILRGSSRVQLIASAMMFCIFAAGTCAMLVANVLYLCNGLSLAVATPLSFVGGLVSLVLLLLVFGFGAAGTEHGILSAVRPRRFLIDRAAGTLRYRAGSGFDRTFPLIDLVAVEVLTEYDRHSVIDCVLLQVRGIERGLPVRQTARASWPVEDDLTDLWPLAAFLGELLGLPVDRRLDLPERPWSAGPPITRGWREIARLPGEPAAAPRRADGKDNRDGITGLPGVSGVANEWGGRGAVECGDPSPLSFPLCGSPPPGRERQGNNKSGE